MKQLIVFLKPHLAKNSSPLLLVLLLTILLGLTEGAGILVLMAFLSRSGLIPTEQGSTTGLFNLIPEFFHGQPLYLTLPLILIIYNLILFLQSLLGKHQAILTSKLDKGLGVFLRSQLYSSLVAAKWPFFFEHKKADLQHILTVEINRIGSFANAVIKVASLMIIASIQISIAALLSTQITCLTLASALFFFLLMQPFLNKSRQAGKAIHLALQSFFGDLNDSLNSIKEIKSYGLEKKQAAHFAKLNQKIETSFLEFARIQAQTNLYYKISSGIILSGFLYVAIAVLQTSAEKLLALILIFSRLWPEFQNLQTNLQTIAVIWPSVQAYESLKNTALANQETAFDPKSRANITFSKAIRCQNVSFRYHNNSPDFAIKDLNTTIPALQTTAIIGASGAGKTTLVDLLLGLLTPEKGHIYLDERPLTPATLTDWRKFIGYVPQDPYLFHSSIRTNLLWAAPAASENEVWDALETAAAADFVKKLANGLDTMIGDQGVRLSGGERQRLVLARALLRQPSLLILDEATSALDTENEQKIRAALEALQGKITIIIIAHRLSSIRHADQILVLDRGRLVANGTFTQLVQAGGRLQDFLSPSP